MVIINLMDPFIIKSKIGDQYQAEMVGEPSKVDNGSGIKWGIQYEVKDEKMEVIGQGHFYVTCPLSHKHLSDNEAYSILLKVGAMSVKKDIDSSLPIWSKSYTFHASSCTE